MAINLTEQQEQKILEGVGKGMANDVIAIAAGLPLHIVVPAILKLCNKHGVPSRAALALKSDRIMPPGRNPFPPEGNYVPPEKIEKKILDMLAKGTGSGRIEFTFNLRHETYERMIEDMSAAAGFPAAFPEIQEVRLAKFWRQSKLACAAPEQAMAASGITPEHAAPQPLEPETAEPEPVVSKAAIPQSLISKVQAAKKAQKPRKKRTLAVKDAAREMQGPAVSPVARKLSIEPFKLGDISTQLRQLIQARLFIKHLMEHSGNTPQSVAQKIAEPIAESYKTTVDDLCKAAAPDSLARPEVWEHIIDMRRGLPETPVMRRALKQIAELTGLTPAHRNYKVAAALRETLNSPKQGPSPTPATQAAMKVPAASTVPPPKKQRRLLIAGEWVLR